MKTLVLLSLIVITAVAKPYQVQSWGLPEIEHFIECTDEIDRNLFHCLNLAYNYYMNEVNLIDSPQIMAEDLKAPVPSPYGRPAWNIEELKRGAAVILDNIHLNNNLHAEETEHDHVTFLQEIKDALECMTPSTGKVNNTDDLITLNILSTLLAFMEESLENVTIVENGYKVEVPMVDISIWSADAIQTAVDTQTTHHKLMPFLKQALIEPAHFNNANGKYCVITPVSVIPTAKRDYYLSNATQNLLHQIKTSLNTRRYL